MTALHDVFVIPPLYYILYSLSIIEILRLRTTAAELRRLQKLDSELSGTGGILARPSQRAGVSHEECLPRRYQQRT